jgi:hypothetical protein
MFEKKRAAFARINGPKEVNYSQREEGYNEGFD